MAKLSQKAIRLFHWNEEEAQELIALLAAAGYDVRYPGPSEASPYSRIRAMEAFAVVLDLSRMPSHGRAVGAEIRRYKGLRHVPLVFVDGKEDAILRTKAILPDAVYTSREQLVAVLQDVRWLEDPVVPKGGIVSDRPTAAKLGIRDGMRVALYDAPADYARTLGPLPRGATLEEVPRGACEVTLLFVRERDAFFQWLRRLPKLAASTKLWVVYPKQSAKTKVDSQLTQATVREGCIGAGLVDYKVCSVDETWTGLCFALKK
jgi:hypothetical protein